MKLLRSFASAAVLAAMVAGGTAHASLTSFQSFVGNYGVSTSGWGSTTNSGTITADVPVGATVVAAYLYTSTFNNGTLSGVGGTLAGNAVTYSTLGTNSDACCSLTAARTDVTSIVKPLIDGGPGGVYNFAITETSGSQDGEALVVVYQLPALPNGTVGILDGFASVSGDSTSINFVDPLHPAAPGFFAEMRLGIGFSYDGTGCTGGGQSSQVAVNGTVITNSAGCNDDSVDATPGNGNLITVGGSNDPFSPLLPSIANDHERYNLVPYITDGDTSIIVHTANSSQDDNIFLAVFDVAGVAGINVPPPTSLPEPTSLALLAVMFAGLGATTRRKTSRRR